MAKNEARGKTDENCADSEMRKVVDGSTKSKKQRAFEKKMKNSTEIVTVASK